MKTRHFIALVSIMMAFFLTSCKYDYVVVPKAPPIDPEVPVKFAAEIVPIFTGTNNCIACHKTGGTAPDLTADNAYSSIVPALVNTTDAESSIIYQFPHPLSATHAWKKYSAAEAELILVWIKQGAKNN